MANIKENLFVLTPVNFKENKSFELESKPNTPSDCLDKYDPLIFCRTCASVDSCLVPIFKEEGLNYNLNQKIGKYLPIRVSEEDDLPLHLCYHCASTLIAWDNLVLGCIEAERKLTLLKNSFENKQNDEVIDDVSNLLNDSIDSDDEPLLNKNTARLTKINEKRDILQEKNDLQISKPTDIETGGPRRLAPKYQKLSSRPSKNIENVKNSKKCVETEKKVPKSNKKEPEEGIENHPYKCPICHKTYTNSSEFCVDLYSHLGLVEDSEKLNPKVCKICNVSCEINQLIRHIFIHVNSKNSKEKSEKVNVKEDKSDEETGKPACNICGKTISKKYNLKRHMATHSGEKKYTCHHCGKQYAQESGLQRHLMVIHEGVRKYKCPICSEIFGSNSELKSHQDTHTDPKPFQCDQCGKTFNRQKHLYYHRKYHHTKNGMRELCKVCNRYFSSPSVMRRHYKVIHMGLKEFQCHICSAQLTTKSYLQEHLRLHSDERPEVCSFCGKTFQMSGNLRQHLKTHMGKNQVCDVCGKRFTRRGHLVIHMGSHRGLEHPRCERCDRVFLLKADLEKHIEKEHPLKADD